MPLALLYIIPMCACLEIWSSVSFNVFFSTFIEMRLSNSCDRAISVARAQFKKQVVATVNTNDLYLNMERKFLSIVFN